ncbi:MAG: sulfatase-like hydrolase/transferase [Fuerstiella sp.]|nr:sulfatase-like hydrolase/transferase [Fuerstiella sp.]MCP4855712.1 sulfatase-like hydrolase/transferase [Fuerstiella sp.]
MDATVGAMLDQLDRLGIADNTLFVFVSDHGTKGKWTLHDHNGTAVPCIMRWPKVIKARSVSSGLIQTTDFVPTFLDIAGVKKPDGYRVDGISLRPMFSNPANAIHEHLFFELGNARGVRTGDWKHIAVRYNTEHFARIQSVNLMRLPRALAYIGNDKTLSNQLGRRPHYLESDQLYHLGKDPLEANNLAHDTEYSEQLKKMKSVLLRELEPQARPFGEFIPSSNSVPVEDIQPYLRKLTQLTPIKRGFEIVGPTSSTGDAVPKIRTPEERKRRRDERQKNRTEK